MIFFLLEIMNSHGNKQITYFFPITFNTKQGHFLETNHTVSETIAELIN
jgi:hypothetical protein